MKKQDKNILELIPGQLSIFDIQITETPKKVTQIEVSFTKSSDFITENKESFTNAVIEVTEQQQKTIDKFKAESYVTRIILYAKGSIGIETKETEGFKTHYITKDGKEELSFNNKSPVLPWDRIICYTHAKVPLTKEQVDKFQKLLCEERENIQRVIHRKGDENLLIEASGKIIDILPNGWQIEFESMDHIDCEEDDIYIIPTKIVKEAPTNPEELQQKVKVGDYVQAMNGKEFIEGELFSEYNSGHTFNIIFKKGTKHTAIPRIAITKILKSA